MVWPPRYRQSSNSPNPVLNGYKVSSGSIQLRSSLLLGPLVLLSDLLLLFWGEAVTVSSLPLGSDRGAEKLRVDVGLNEEERLTRW